jgi:acid-sensing ion channel 5
MAEIRLVSKEFDTLKGDGKDQATPNPKQENAEIKKKSNLQKYAENNSVGGLSYVLSSKSKIRRLIWLIIILVCVAISLYLVRNTFSKLLDPPTSTTITNEPNLNLEFPAVTICNVNTFSPNILRSYEILPNQTLEEGIFFDIFFTNPLNDPTLKQLTSNATERFIVNCWFGNQFCGNNIYRNFEFSLNDLFACYTFNSGQSGKPIQKVNGTGANEGLTLVIDTDDSDYSSPAKADTGIKIVLHPQDEPPHPNSHGVAVSPSASMYISFRKQVYDDRTMRSCSPTSQHKWMHLSEEIPYSYASCLMDSLINASLNQCGCVLSTDYLSSDKQYPLCTLSQLICYLNSRFSPRNHCKPACKHTTFEILSATHTESYSRTFLSRSIIFVSIYYETFNVQTQTTVFSYGIEEFFAEVGGQLGLFIGVSVITLFEFVIFLVDELKNRIKKRLRKRCKYKTLCMHAANKLQARNRNMSQSTAV